LRILAKAQPNFLLRPVSRAEIFIRATKNGKSVRLPVPPELQVTLGALQLPRGGAPDCPYFFWTGNGLTSAVTGSAKRTMDAVYAASGVEGACNLDSVTP